VVWIPLANSVQALTTTEQIQKRIEGLWDLVIALNGRDIVVLVPLHVIERTTDSKMTKMTKLPTALLIN
jgi:hypothetical protein